MPMKPFTNRWQRLKSCLITQGFAAPILRLTLGSRSIENTAESILA